MISVIIPCFNTEDYLGRAIESVLMQTFTDYEIILVNNNSSDNTSQIMMAYTTKNPNVFKIFNEYKKGAPAARNKGLYKAKGEWIQFLDADDELLPDKLQKQITIALSSKADIIAGSCYMHRTVKGKINITIRDVETNDVWKGLLLSKLGITSANLWRTKAVLSSGGWNEARTSSQEYDLLFKMLKNNYKIDFCLLPLSIVHVRENSIHRSLEEQRFIEIIDNNMNLRLDIKGHLKSKSLLTNQLKYTTDTYIYSHLLNSKEILPTSANKKIVTAYINKKLREIRLQLPLKFVISFHFKRAIKK